MISKFRKLFLQTEFRISLFIISIGLFIWPMITIPNLSNVKLVVSWLYFSWLAVIIFSFLHDQLTPDEEEKDQR